MNVKPLMTAEEFWMMPEEPGKRFELVHGKVTEIPLMGGRQGLIATNVAIFLRTHAHQRKLGFVCSGGVGCILARNPDVVLLPDASFVARHRISQSGIPEGFWPFAPDLVVEIDSPDDRPGEVQAKVGEYLDAGSRAVWVMWPERQALTVHRFDGTSVELGPADEVDGGDVLPGFRVGVGDLFEIEA